MTIEIANSYKCACLRTIANSLFPLTYCDTGQQWSKEKVVSWRDDGDLKLARLQVADDAQRRPTRAQNDHLLLLAGERGLCEFLDVFPAIVGT